MERRYIMELLERIKNLDLDDKKAFSETMRLFLTYAEEGIVEELAKDVGVAPATVKKWAKGSNPRNPTKVKALDHMRAHLENSWFVDLDCHYSETQVRDACDDGWDQGDYEHHFECVIARLRRSRWPVKETRPKPKPGEDIFVAVEIYGYGSTFGHTTGHPEAHEWFYTYDEAANWISTAPVNTDFFGGHEEWLIERVMLRDDKY